MLQGKKVRLREVRKNDVSNFLKWLNDSEVTQYLTIFLPMMEASEEKWINDLALSKNQTDIVFVIEVKIRKHWVPIGNCGIHGINWHNRDAEMGMIIGEKKFWSKGYGTEAAKLLVDYAFLQLNLHRVSAGAYSFNIRSIKMQKRAGFIEEGCIRRAVYKNGQYHDKILLGILQEEWEKSK